MKRYIILSGLLISILIFGLSVVVQADPPQQGGPPPGKGATGPGQMQEAVRELDRSSSSVVELKLTETGKLVPGSPEKNQPPEQDIGTEVVQIIKAEDFEGVFPNTWEMVDVNGSTGGIQFWTDVPCQARTGDWAGWPAGPAGTDGVNPCLGADYPPDVSSWMIFGPFSVQGAQSASLDFYFKMISELDFDEFFWGASVDGDQFFGTAASGTFDSGPEGNNYYFRSLDLTNVFTLGDLTDDPQVWIAFTFDSDFIFEYEGPFIDDISLSADFPESPSSSRVYLPVLVKTQITIPKTNLYINNQTGGVINYYKVFSPKFDGVIIPDIVCSNIPTGATNHNCNASFDTDTYQVESSNTCNPPVSAGQVTFNQGNDVRLIRCLSN